MKVVHEPTRPVRTDVLGEVVFLEVWQAWNKQVVDDNSRYVPFLRTVIARSVRSERRTITQREATVSASFVKWLGTNVGNGFLLEIQRKHADEDMHYLNISQRYVEHWAKENCTNQQTKYRRIEMILATDADYGPTYLPGLSSLTRHVNYTVHDLDVIECIVHWLGSDEGQEFISCCEKKIKKLLIKQYQQQKSVTC